MGAVADKPLVDVRGDFPILTQEVAGRPIAYLDSAATSQKPVAVLEAMDRYYREANAPVHRSVYPLAAAATEAFEGARERIADFTGWDVPTTIFTANATAAINLVAYSWGRANVDAGDEVLITQMEHHSNIVPWQQLCEERGARLRYVPVTESGELSLDEVDAALGSGRVKLLGVTHVSNVLGTINPVAEIVARARAAGAVTLVDGSQAVPQLPVDLRAIDADFYAWTGHKALGPTGIGVLHGRRELLEAMPPFIAGGHMISRVDAETSTWNELPWKFEAGTSQMAEAAGLAAAVEYLSAIGMEDVRAHEQDLTAYALERLSEVEGLGLLGPPAERRGGAISFTLGGVHPHDVAELCGRTGVCIRAGHHCAQPLMRQFGVPATARASFGVYNSREDVDRLVEALGEARKVFEL